MREFQLAEQRQRVAFAFAVGRGRPLAYSVDGENGSALERAREERAGRVAFMVLGEHNGCAAWTLTVGGPQMPAQLPTHEQLVLQPDGHRRAEAAES